MPKNNIISDEEITDDESSYISDDMLEEEENSEISDYEDYDSETEYNEDDMETKQSEQIDTETSISDNEYIKNPDKSLFYSNDRKKTRIYVDNSERISKPILTKYEYVRILAERTKQIASGAKPMILNASELLKKLTPKEIAKIEIKNKTVPFIIIRDIGQNRYEKWKLSDLENFYE